MMMGLKTYNRGWKVSQETSSFTKVLAVLFFVVAMAASLAIIGFGFGFGWNTGVITSDVIFGAVEGGVTSSTVEGGVTSFTPISTHE